MAHNIPNPPKGTPINRHWKLKTGGRIGSGLTSLGVSIGQTATGNGTLTVLSAAAAGAAVSATGVGLVITAGVLTIGSSAVAARAAHKTRKHRKHLKDIYANRNEYDCAGVDDTNIFHHKVISEDILPYVIKQKGKKFRRKVMGSIPGVGLLESLRSFGKMGWKRITGTKGKERRNAAMWMANHLLSHNCELVEAIIAELYSEEEMLWIKYHCDGENATHFIFEKLAST